MHFTLADLITDITQNGAEADSTVVELDVQQALHPDGTGEFRFTVKDNGKGMTESELKRAQDPFVTDGIKHPNRKVGLGLPFLIQTAEQSGGGWAMSSVKRPLPDCGTTVNAWFDLGNVDTPPLGDIPGMFRTVLLFQGPDEVLIRRDKKSPETSVNYELRKTDLIEALGSLEEAQSLVLLDKYLRSLEDDVSEEDSSTDADDV